MRRYDYYESLKKLARKVRAKYGLTTPRVLRSDMRRIYDDRGIHLDVRNLGSKIRGAYFNDDCGVHVVISEALPEDPAVFTMAHELKHDLEDKDAALSLCTNKNESDPIEIGAEIFAAEMLFPEPDFIEAMKSMQVKPGKCTPEHLVRLKATSQTTLSYEGLKKRALWLKFATVGAFANVTSWSAIHRRLFGSGGKPRR